METITVTRAGVDLDGFDEQGNPVRGVDVVFDVVAKAVAPLTPDESAALFGPENRGGYTLYLPLESGLQSPDLVSVRGEGGFQVWGGTAQWAPKTLFTGAQGDVVVVRRAS
jgi:hypothetical protein